MIKANELRLGNWINFLNLIEPEKYVQVTGRFMLSLTKDDYISSYYAPIPLTPEILEKAGFKGIDIEEANFDGHIKLNEDYRLEYSYGFKEFSINGMFLPVSPKYLHELQNLYFALSGEELTIQL